MMFEDDYTADFYVLLLENDIFVDWPEEGGIIDMYYIFDYLESNNIEFKFIIMVKL